MGKTQLIVLSSAILLLLLLYFGCETKAKQQKLVEKSRTISAESTDITTLLQTANAQISTAEKDKLALLSKKLDAAESDTSKVSVLKQISGAWYALNHAEIAGDYAEKVAEVEKSENAWSIAGTTYLLGIQQSKDDVVRDYCRGRAIKSFEFAASLNPNNITHKVNIALCYTENPLKDNPMKGILLLRELDTQNPNNPLILATLGRLAIKTGQYDKAVERLEKALSLDTNNNGIICLLAQAWQGKGDNTKAAMYSKKCK